MNLAGRSSERPLDEQTVADDLVQRVRRRLAAGELVREHLPGGERLHVDRALPFLCIYRRPAHRRDPDTQRFVTDKPAYLLVPEERAQGAAVTLARVVMQTMMARFGGFLFLEVRTVCVTRNEADIARSPTARIRARTPSVPEEPLRTLERRLESLPLDEGQLQVDVIEDEPGNDPLVDMADSAGAHYVTIDLDPIHYDPATGTPFPLLMRSMRDELAVVLRATLFEFCRAHTSFSPRNAVSLGRREVLASDWAVDRALAEIANDIHLLLHVTPVNVAEARAAFLEGPGDREPKFHYRHVTIDPDLRLRQLYEIPLDEVEDPTLLRLFREQRAAIADRLRMLGDRNTRKFLYTSLQLYGGVGEKLLRLAMGLTAAIDPRQKHDLDRGHSIGAHELESHARHELEHYHQQCSAFQGSVEVRDDVAGLLVDEGRLLIERDLSVVSSRLDAILQHEVGTHVVTHFNGSQQPLRLLASGLAGYDELQEGLAVLAEYLVGQLVASRLRVLAGRVIAVRQCTDGAGFLDIYRSLSESYGFGRRAAFDMAMRVSRSGGFTKDVVYLRGLVWLLGHLERGHSIEPLFIGKPGISQLGAIEELVERRVLAPPRLRPRFLDSAEASKRLEVLRKGASVLELVERRRS
jgi:uncharacterized protein (TIGR02421 family)